MLTHLFKSINWIDVILALMLLRMIFVGVKNGFISEFFKLLGVITAVFVSFHFYSHLAVWPSEKTSFSLGSWELVIFAGLWFAVLFIFRFIRQGILFLFKVETNHQGFDKYAAGIAAVGRGLLVCSLVIFLILLTHNSFLTQRTFHSYGYKIAGRAALNTYSFLYDNLVDKLFPNGHYNAAAAEVLRPETSRPNQWK